MVEGCLTNLWLQFSDNHHCSRVGAERRAWVLIPLGDLLHSGIVTEHRAIQSCTTSTTLDGLVSYAHAQNLKSGD